jgi:hypothetical protein
MALTNLTTLLLVSMALVALFSSSSDNGVAAAIVSAFIFTRHFVSP